jgi:hypothetical protein
VENIPVIIVKYLIQIYLCYLSTLPIIREEFEYEIGFYHTTKQTLKESLAPALLPMVITLKLLAITVVAALLSIV